MNTKDYGCEEEILESYDPFEEVDDYGDEDKDIFVTLPTDVEEVPENPDLPIEDTNSIHPGSDSGGVDPPIETITNPTGEEIPLVEETPKKKSFVDRIIDIINKIMSIINSK